MYSTVDELTTWLGDYPPVNASTLLTRASLVIDDALVGAVYAVDVDGMPTDSVVVGALRDAVCAQVAWWMSMTDSGTGSARLRRVTRPGQQLDMKNAQTATEVLVRQSQSEVAPDATRALAVVGLLPIRARTWG